MCSSRVNNQIQPLNPNCRIFFGQRGGSVRGVLGADSEVAGDQKQSMKTKNPAAVALAALSKGKPKNYSPEERERRRQRIAEARKKIKPRKVAARWAKKNQNNERH